VEGQPANQDPYQTWEELRQALRQVESSNLIIGIDHTKSNRENGYHGENLHALSNHKLNPYQQVITMLYQSLVPRMDDDQKIPVYGFGCSTTTNKLVFSYDQYQTCHSLEDILYRYRTATTLPMAGPTNFAPLIYEAIDIVKETGRYHILIIGTDGVVDRAEDVEATRQAIIAARDYPLSIIW
jgi:E3 ubiquitin-protein ligase RGLG